MSDASPSVRPQSVVHAGLLPRLSAASPTPCLREAGQHAHGPQCPVACLSQPPGETGLDFNRNFSPPDVQERWFDAQVRPTDRPGSVQATLVHVMLLPGGGAKPTPTPANHSHTHPPLPGCALPQVALAAELGKPLFMHCRDAGERFAAILAVHGERGGAPGVLHCFTGSGEELAQCLALDLHIGITGARAGGKL